MKVPGKNLLRKAGSGISLLLSSAFLCQLAEAQNNSGKFSRFDEGITWKQRYDGQPDLKSVDISFAGFWGEGGSHLLSARTRVSLINCYLDNFRKTPLIFQPLNGDAPDSDLLVKRTAIAAYWADGRNNGAGSQVRHLGYRLDCPGDSTTDLWKKEERSYLKDSYPKDIVKSGMAEACKKAPVTWEICYTFLPWLEKLIYFLKTERVFPGIHWLYS